MRHGRQVGFPGCTEHKRLGTRYRLAVDNIDRARRARVLLTFGGCLCDAFGGGVGSATSDLSRAVSGGELDSRVDNADCSLCPGGSDVRRACGFDLFAGRLMVVSANLCKCLPG